MAKYVKTDYVPEDCDYLTVDKEYQIYDCDDVYGCIIDDEGDEINICIGDSCHIDGSAWTVINR